MATTKRKPAKSKPLILKQIPPATHPDLSKPAHHYACPSCHSTKTRVLGNLVFCMVCCEAQVIRPASSGLTKKKAS